MSSYSCEEPQILSDFIKGHMPSNWQTWRTEVINCWMARLGRQQVGFVHRPGTEKGVLKLHPFRPDQVAFFWEEEDIWLTSTEYYQLRYGRLVADGDWMVEVLGDRRGELFPLDMVKIY
ncbi:hypothetical protein CAEBREN_20191 [Caenorhabditis brenneri]|uniref:Uncharacterized protein n=1 Tax=Caenorhabditis brenneri TaxID=135651 RepID=G0N2L7_CAEBE|nr:hypothetical protein CAEBREN_20191 [Caenorhabditis brenneri]